MSGDLTGGVKKPLRLITKSDSFHFVEAFKTLRTNVKFIAGVNDAKVVMITSSQPDEGKTNVAINLAVSLAEDGQKTILLDCDFRKMSIQRYLKLPRQSAGLVEFLTGEVKYEDIILHFKDLKIDVLPAGAVSQNPSELMGSKKMGQLLQVLADHYDFVICDTPPLNLVSDAAALGVYTDGAILVISHNNVTRQAASSAERQLEMANVKILGTVLSLYDNRKGGDYSSRYSYYNYYGGGMEEEAQAGSESGRRRTR